LFIVFWAKKNTNCFQADKLDLLAIFLLLADVSPTYSSGLPQGKKNKTNCFVTIKNDFVFSSIITTNIQKTLQPTNAGAEHTYIIRKY